MTFGMDFSGYKDRKKNFALQFTFPSRALTVCSSVCFNRATGKIQGKEWTLEVLY